MAEAGELGVDRCCARHVEYVAGLDIFDNRVGRQAILRQTDPAVTELGADLFMLLGVKTVFGEQGGQVFLSG